MYSLNRATIIGNVTRDPEVRQIPSGQSVCTFGVATNRTWKDAQGNRKEAADFHNVVAWGKLAEICAQYLAKGRKVYVEGRLQTRDWEGQDGIKRYRTEIIADNMIILDRGGAAGAPGAERASGFSQTPPPPPDEPSANPDDEIKLEEVPF